MTGLSIPSLPIPSLPIQAAILAIDLLTAVGVLFATAATDAVDVMFSSVVAA